MARVWHDGLEDGVGDQFTAGHTGVAVADSPGSWSTYCYEVAQFQVWGEFLPAAYSELWFRCYFKPFGIGAGFVAEGYPLVLADATGAWNAYLFLQGGAGAGLLKAAAGGIIRGDVGWLNADEWYLMEAHHLVAQSGGVFDVWINDTEYVFSYTGDTQAAGSTDQIVTCWTPAPFSGRYRYDDLAVNDPTNDATPNTGRIGDSGIIGLKPNAVGDHSQWIPVGAVANWQAVDEVPPDEDTTYVHSNTVGDRDLYNLEDLPASFPAVNAARLKWRARRVVPGGRSIKPLLKHSGTVDVGASEFLTSGWKTHGRTYSKNPVSVSAWTVSDINALQAGEELAS